MKTYYIALMAALTFSVYFCAGTAKLVQSHQQHTIQYIEQVTK